jgi:spore germination protein
MNTVIRNFIFGFVATGLLLIAGSMLVTQHVSAQTTIKKPVTQVKKPAVKAPVKKTTTKAVAKKVATPKEHTLLKAGWIPYWSKTAGSTETSENLSHLNIISPFSYYVDTDGSLIDRLKINQAPWPELISEARAKKIAVYPTIAWFDRTAIHTVLSDKNLREAHIFEITNQILDNPSFDGVDIDYENKSDLTKDYFSQFLKELSVQTKARKKKLICTIEPRTPVDSRFRVLTAENIENSKKVSNDYKEINKYCDQVRIMTYDQREADVKLNDKHGKTGAYIPVSDPVWVEKVIQLAIKDIAPSKIMVGIPTFGYKWELTPKAGGGYIYTKLRAMNYDEAFAEARKRGVQIERNVAGEYSFMYPAPDSPSFAGNTGVPLHLVWFPDAESMYNKIELARKYKLGGVAVFKFDGGADQSMWDVMRLTK